MEMLLLYFLLIVGIMMLPIYIKYKGSVYKIASGNSFIKTVFDKGNYGEFLTFTKLEKLSEYKKLMTNLYLPKEDGSTTEIDLIMISETGIYVFESKNYSGWIFGDEKQKNWTQTLVNKKKNRFFNPIWQNKGHITALKSAVGMDDLSIYQSYIIFSERCTLKKINIISKNVKVMKRNDLLKEIKRDFLNSEKILNKEQIVGIYAKLARYCWADDKFKKEHIDKIKR